LHYGAHNAHEEVVALLLQNSADIGVTDNRGSTPVHMAADGGSEAIVKLLLDHGADLNARSTQG
ncbi:ankyrin, partial [Zopfia rhizophila CBS 207.26]